ncbi:MAG: hypothetical protein ACFCVD_23665 [Nodosilinea sp.]
MKRVPIVLLSLSLGLSLTLVPNVFVSPTLAQTTPASKTVLSRQGRFTVQLPTTPQTTTATTTVAGDTLTWILSQGRDGDSVYAVAYTDLPLKVLAQGREAVLASLQASPLVAELDWASLSSGGRSVTQGELPGIEFFHLADGQVSVLRLYLANRRVYAVMAASTDLAGVNQFIDSFTIDSIWRPYTSEVGRFSVNVPMAPVATQGFIEYNGIVIDWRQFTARNLMAPGDVYGVAYADLPAGLRSGQNNALVRELARSALASVESFPDSSVAVPITLNDHPGYEYKFTSAAGRGQVLRFYLVDGRMYSVLAASNSLANLDRFLSSFQVPSAGPTIVP